MPDAYGEELAAWGKVVLLETTGRRSGQPRRTALGFVEEPDGSLLVAAGSPASDWAANLLADPDCHGTIAGSRRAYRAEELGGAERARAITGLILRYGTPAERLGSGPAFRLRPAAGAAPAAEAALAAEAAPGPDAAREPDRRAPG
jgi:deazaflavin-dependent oxidoreductase (nitroreductase family)